MGGILSPTIVPKAATNITPPPPADATPGAPLSVQTDLEFVVPYDNVSTGTDELTGAVETDLTIVP